MKRDLLIINGDEVTSLLANRELALMDRVTEAYKMHASGSDSLPHSVFLHFPADTSSRIIALPAYLGADFNVAGLKWISSFPNNVTYGLDRASGIVVVNSVDTGFPETIIEASVINAKRTAASAVVAVKHLIEGGTPQKVALVGCGIINYEILRFLKAAWPEINEVTLYDKCVERAQQFQDKCAEALGMNEALVMRDINELLASASLISFATTATEPHVTDISSCLAPTTTILHVSLRDLSPEVILSSINIVDDIDHICRVDTSIALAEKQACNRQFISATLPEILLGKKVYTRDYNGRQVTIFSPFGLGILDLAVASFVRDLALVAGVGMAARSFVPASWVRV